MSTGIGGIGAGGNAISYPQMQRRAGRAGEEDAKVGGAGREYNQAEYLKELNKRVDANVSAGVWNGGASPFGKSDKSQVMIHPDFLRVMHDDPEVGAYYEDQINIYAKGDAAFKKSIEARGGTVDSSGMYVNEKGEMTAMTVATVPGPNESRAEEAKSDKKKTAKEAMEELLEKLREKKQKEKAEAKTAAADAAQAEMMESGEESAPAVDVYA